MDKQNCIDIIVLNNLSFKRYCELAKCIGKRIAIVTDNDGDIEINIKGKYTRKYNIWICHPICCGNYLGQNG